MLLERGLADPQMVNVFEVSLLLNQEVLAWLSDLASNVRGEA